ncbi:unnamed protein product [Amoebophrya sp. A25]|nr:unnamed protein product [Amoebophrya sp. A25]|eukprot:GSA25T00014443001.1
MTLEEPFDPSKHNNMMALKEEPFDPKVASKPRRHRELHTSANASYNYGTLLHKIKDEKDGAGGGGGSGSTTMNTDAHNLQGQGDPLHQEGVRYYKNLSENALSQRIIWLALFCFGLFLTMAVCMEHFVRGGNYLPFPFSGKTTTNKMSDGWPSTSRLRGADTRRAHHPAKPQEEKPQKQAHLDLSPPELRTNGKNLHHRDEQRTTGGKNLDGARLHAAETMAKTVDPSANVGPDELQVEKGDRERDATTSDADGVAHENDPVKQLTSTTNQVKALASTSQVMALTGSPHDINFSRDNMKESVVNIGKNLDQGEGDGDAVEEEEEEGEECATRTSSLTREMLFLRTWKNPTDFTQLASRIQHNGPHQCLPKRLLSFYYPAARPHPILASPVVSSPSLAPSGFFQQGEQQRESTSARPPAPPSSKVERAAQGLCGVLTAKGHPLGAYCSAQDLPRIVTRTTDAQLFKKLTQALHKPQLGAGSFGTVFDMGPCEDKRYGGAACVVKAIRGDWNPEEVVREAWIQQLMWSYFETTAKSGLRRRKYDGNCVGFVSSVVIDDRARGGAGTPYLVMEKLGPLPRQGSLLYDASRPETMERAEKARECLSIINEEIGVTHGDFKGENALLDLQTQGLRLADFGVSTIWIANGETGNIELIAGQNASLEQLSCAGTPFFMHPSLWRVPSCSQQRLEEKQKTPYTPIVGLHIDLYALGTQLIRDVLGTWRNWLLLARILSAPDYIPGITSKAFWVKTDPADLFQRCWDVLGGAGSGASPGTAPYEKCLQGRCGVCPPNLAHFCQVQKNTRAQFARQHLQLSAPAAGTETESCYNGFERKRIQALFDIEDGKRPWIKKEQLWKLYILENKAARDLFLHCNSCIVLLCSCIYYILHNITHVRELSHSA